MSHFSFISSFSTLRRSFFTLSSLGPSLSLSPYRPVRPPPLLLAPPLRGSSAPKNPTTRGGGRCPRPPCRSVTVGKSRWSWSRMEEAKGLVKHVLLAKFKEGISADEIEKLIKGYANLVNLIEPMESFHWGTDVSSENMHQGFTHIFESTFESTEGVAEYVAHPAHVEFATLFLAALEKVVVFDYKPTIVHC